MGWSATADACSVMNALYEFCSSQGGTTNGWEHNGQSYFAECGKEHEDGHISMTIWKTVRIDSEGRGWVKRSGSIYIEPDGVIRRMPKYLKAAIAPYIRFEHLRGVVAETQVFRIMNGYMPG